MSEVLISKNLLKLVGSGDKVFIDKEKTIPISIISRTIFCIAVIESVFYI
jgi:hypothetical protein